MFIDYPFKSVLFKSKNKRFELSSMLESTVFYFGHMLGDYNLRVDKTVVKNAKLETLASMTISKSSISGFASGISEFLNQGYRDSFYFVLDESSKVNSSSYMNLCQSKHFSTNKTFNFIYKSDLDELLSKSIPPTVSVPKYSKNSAVDFTIATTDLSEYAKKVNCTNLNYKSSVLDVFSQGNLYMFLDCEMQDNNVKEISVISALMGSVQLVPISKIICMHENPVKTCAQFITKFVPYLKELQEKYKVGKVYFVGHNIQLDLLNIHRTLGIEDSYALDMAYVDTGDLLWQDTWNTILFSCSGIYNGGIKLEEIKKGSLISNETLATVTKDIFNVEDTKQHTSMFDTTLLLVLVNLLLLRRVDIEAYKVQHFNLMNNIWKV